MKSLFRFITLAIIVHFLVPLGATAQNVLLQSSTPGTTQTGHMNINGTGLFGRSISIGTLSSSNNIGLNISKALSTANTVYGASANISNSSTGAGYGGYFGMSGTGTGTHYGVYGTATGNSASSTYGVFGTASNSSSGAAYGGYFSSGTTGTGTDARYGISAAGVGNASTASIVFGAYASASSPSASKTYGGFFFTTSSGTGEHYGTLSSGVGTSAGSIYGAYANATNYSTGPAYAGYFSAPALGTGTHYGVYGVEAAGGSGAAVYAAGDFVASGTKSAVVQTSNGHRLMYAQESPEVWFEDYGQGQLINGQAHVDLDAFFLETVSINSAHPMKVFVQLTSGDPVPVVVEKGQTGFAIRAQNQLNASFDYRVVAKRKGYENDRLRITQAGHEDPNLYPELWAEMEKKREEERRRQKSERELQERELKKQEQLQQEQQTQRFETEADLVKSNEPATFIDGNLQTPEANALIQNHPNPFNPATNIQFDVKQAGRVTLKVYNSLGQEVANLLDQNLPAGRHTANFDATGLPSGAYFYKLSVNGFTEVKRMELVK